MYFNLRGGGDKTYFNIEEKGGGGGGRVKKLQPVTTIQYFLE